MCRSHVSVACVGGLLPSSLPRVRTQGGTEAAKGTQQGRQTCRFHSPHPCRPWKTTRSTQGQRPRPQSVTKPKGWHPSHRWRDETRANATWRGENNDIPTPSSMAIEDVPNGDAHAMGKRRRCIRHQTRQHKRLRRSCVWAIRGVLHDLMPSMHTHGNHTNHMHPLVDRSSDSTTCSLHDGFHRSIRASQTDQMLSRVLCSIVIWMDVDDIDFQALHMVARNHGCLTKGRDSQII